MVSQRGSCCLTTMSQSSHSSSGRTIESQDLSHTTDVGSRRLASTTGTALNHHPSSLTGRQNVHFFHAVEVFLVPSCRDYSHKVMHRTYYTQEELARCQPQEYKEFSSCSKEECLRGMESWGKKGYSIDRQHKCQITRTAVFLEQQRQRHCADPSSSTKENNIDELARLYVKASKALRANTDARIAALEDEYFVKTQVYHLPCSKVASTMSQTPTFLDPTSSSPSSGSDKKKKMKKRCQKCTCNQNLDWEGRSSLSAPRIPNGKTRRSRSPKQQPKICLPAILVEKLNPLRFSRDAYHQIKHLS
jgi:hypothetical protein